MNAPIVVVGAGAAGLSTALAAAPAPVLLLSRGADGEGSTTALARGGIAAAVGTGDRVEAHAIDTLSVGALHNDTARVLWLCAQAPEVLAWLERHGVVFERCSGGALRLGREGGHGAARIARTRGGTTGNAVFRALAGSARAAAHVQWLGGLQVDALFLRGGRVCGVGARAADGSRRTFEASAVVLATGGIGALFSHTSNPSGADGAGLALALAAGARGRDLEFVQFHPTALDVPDCRRQPLITEALRGAGARLRDSHGRNLMDGRHPQGDLAPCAVVARCVWQAQRDGARVVLDATDIRHDWPGSFPDLLALCRWHGIDPLAAPIPVTAAAHFHMGGLAVDSDGRTSLAGLHAVGEIACSGVHGAGRLSSNSLLEGVAYGCRIGAWLANSPRPAGGGRERCCRLDAGLPPARQAALRDLLWQAAGPVRSPATLRRALRTCVDWIGEGWQARLAVAVLASALHRRGSLGAHWIDAGGEAPVRPHAAGPP